MLCSRQRVPYHEQLSVDCDGDEHAITTAAEVLERRLDIANIEV